MKWTIRFLPEAEEDLQNLDGSQSRKVAKAIDRTLTNPLPRSQGGYGIELGNKGGVNLTNCLEIKLRGEGLRAIYKLIHTDTEIIYLHSALMTDIFLTGIIVVSGKRTSYFSGSSFLSVRGELRKLWRFI